MKPSQKFALVAVAGMSFWSSVSTTQAGPLDVWHTRSSGVTNVLNADAYGNGAYVVVGNEGRIVTSSDGVAWTRRSSGTANSLNSLVFVNGLFVAVGEGGTILTSANGQSWTPRSSGTSDFLYDVSYGNGKFIAISDTGTVVSSTNGIAWNSSSGGTVGAYGVAYGNGKFVAVGGLIECSFFGCYYYSDVVYASADGVTWVQSTPGARAGVSRFPAPAKPFGIWRSATARLWWLADSRAGFILLRTRSLGRRIIPELRRGYLTSSTPTALSWQSETPARSSKPILSPRHPGWRSRSPTAALGSPGRLRQEVSLCRRQIIFPLRPGLHPPTRWRPM